MDATINNMNIDNIFGIPVYIATYTFQRRKHHKKRINKKWLKRYGVYEYDLMPYGDAVVFDNKIWMTKKTYEAMLKVSKIEVRNEYK